MTTRLLQKRIGCMSPSKNIATMSTQELLLMVQLLASQHAC